MGPSGESPRNPKDANRSDAFEDYHTVAETVGGIPSFRLKDNLIQTAFIAATLIIGLGIGYLVTKDMFGAGVGGFLGLIAGLLVSGVVLMVLGWKRAIRRLGGRKSGGQSRLPN